VLNAAAAIYVSGRVETYGEGVAAAAKAIDSGEAKSVLGRLRQAYTKHIKPAT
jgi:anthranilate phosphoribosyltransferase